MKKRFIIWAAVSLTVAFAAAVLTVASIDSIKAVRVESLQYEQKYKVQGVTCPGAVRIYIPASKAGAVGVGSSAAAYCDGEWHKGNITVLSDSFVPSMTIGSRENCIEAYAEFDNLNASLYAPIDCYVYAGAVTQYYCVPESAVDQDSAGEFVYVIRENMLQKQYITTDDSVIDKRIAVTSGLQDGWLVAFDASEITNSETVGKKVAINEA